MVPREAREAAGEIAAYVRADKAGFCTVLSHAEIIARSPRTKVSGFCVPHPLPGPVSALRHSDREARPPCETVLVGATSPNLAALRRRRDTIRLAGEGMRDVMVAAEFLQHVRSASEEIRDSDDDETERLWRTIETGMATIYARPFLGSQLAAGPLKLPPELSAELRATHDLLLELRHNAYAHTGATPARSVIDQPDTVDEWLVHWIFPTPSGLEDVIALAQAHLRQWVEDLGELDEQIRIQEEVGTPFGTRLG